MNERLAESTGAVRWSSDGDGAALLLLHGLGGDRGFWAAESPIWSEDFRVLTVDLPGAGESLRPDGTPSIAGFADELCGVLDAAGVTTAHVVGFSMGGLVAQALAVRHPQRVDRLVLASTYAVMNPQARLFLDAVREVVLTSGSMRAVFPLVVPWLFSVGFLADPAHADWLHAPEDEDEPVEGWLAQYRAQRAFDGTDLLADIAADTLVIVGSEDRLVTMEDADALVAGIPTASRMVFDGAGHLVNVEDGSRFVREVRAFLRA